MLALIPFILMILFYGSIFIALVYLILKRIEEKKHEDFEQRDN